MLIKLIAAIALLYFIFTWISRYKSATTKDKKQKLLQIAVLALALVLLFGVVTGRMHWLGAVVAGALPFLRSGLTAAMRLAPFLINRTGGKARFRTEHLDVEINIVQRSVSGVVTKGPYAGSQIAQLSPAQLDELVSYYQQHDKKSQFFIRAAQRGFTDQTNPPQEFSGLDKREALQILGLSDNPSKDEIITAHRRLIIKLHPDKGGSEFLASRVNQARDLLLQDLTH